MQSRTLSFPLYLAAILLVAFIGVSSARPMDVWVPPLIHPSNGTVWKVGGSYNVTWNTTAPPAQITNSQGRVVLARNGLQDYEHPLAQNFSIMDGSKEVTVPKDTVPGDEYQIVLFGDSGNLSPRFTITK